MPFLQSHICGDNCTLLWWKVTFRPWHLGPDSPTCVTSASSFTGRIHNTSNSWQHPSNMSPCLAQQSLKMEYSCSTVPCRAGWSTYTRYWMCPISLENQHTKWKLISQNSYPATLFLFYLFPYCSYKTHSQWGKRDDQPEHFWMQRG